MEACHNCGLPADCVSGSGLRVVLCVTPKVREKFKRDRRQTVWCHSEECAVQALAVARYGPDSHTWPITLAQFRAMNPIEEHLAKTTENEPTKRVRASSHAKEQVWADPALTATKSVRPKENAISGPLESMA
jgi:hypothetical protein